MEEDSSSLTERIGQSTMFWRILKTLGFAILLVSTGVGWYLGASVFGVLEMTIYSVFFAIGAFGVVIFVAFMGPTMPGFARKLLGDLNTVLMMMAANVGLLCQADDGSWTLRAGRDVDGQLQVYYGNEWRDVGNREYLSRLGMRPFGVLREKTSKTWKEHREDSEALADGGSLRERARYEARPGGTKDDNNWTLDYTSIVSRLEGAGGIGIIDRAAEQQMRTEADGGSNSVLGLALVGLVAVMMGAVIGLVMTGTL